MSTEQPTNESIEIKQENLLTLQKHLSMLQEKVGAYGPLDAPIRIQTEISELEKEIRKITGELERLSSGEENKSYIKPQKDTTIGSTPNLVEYLLLISILVLILSSVVLLVNKIPFTISRLYEVLSPSTPQPAPITDFTSFLQSTPTLDIIATASGVGLTLILLRSISGKAMTRNKRMAQKLRHVQRVRGNKKTADAKERK